MKYYWKILEFIDTDWKNIGLKFVYVILPNTMPKHENVKKVAF